MSPLEELLALDGAKFDEAIDSLPAWLKNAVCDQLDLPADDHDNPLWDKAYKLRLAAAREGDPRASVFLFRLVMAACPENSSLALTNLIREAEAGCTQAMMALGDYYYNDKSYNKAVNWFKKAVEKGDDEMAYCDLGYCYMRGEGVAQDVNEARRLFQIAIDRFDSAEAMYQMVTSYNYLAVVKDSTIIGYLQRAAEKGHKLAVEYALIIFR